jgi:methionyl-tRNA formyltransferase
MKFGLMGNSTFAEALAEGFVDVGHICSFAVSQPKQSLPDASCGVGDWAVEQKVPFFEIEDLNGADFMEVIKAFGVDFLLASWPKLLKIDTIQSVPLGVVGSHPTPVPWGRGRHPLHWAIAMGLSQTSLSLFLMDAGVDTGLVLSQHTVPIEEGTTIAELQRDLDIAARLVGRVVGEQLERDGQFSGLPQDAAIGSLWRRRTEFDVQIDCRMSCDAIRRLVNSYSAPFPRARLLTPHASLPIDDATVLKIPRRLWEFNAVGTVLEVNQNTIDIRVDDGVIRLRASEAATLSLHSGDSIPPPAFFR